MTFGVGMTGCVAFRPVFRDKVTFSGWHAACEMKSVLVPNPPRSYP